MVPVPLLTTGTGTTCGEVEPSRPAFFVPPRCWIRLQRLGEYRVHTIILNLKLNPALQSLILFKIRRDVRRKDLTVKESESYIIGNTLIISF